MQGSNKEAESREQAPKSHKRTIPHSSYVICIQCEGQDSHLEIYRHFSHPVPLGILGSGPTGAWAFAGILLVIQGTPVRVCQKVICLSDLFEPLLAPWVLVRVVFQDLLFRLGLWRLGSVLLHNKTLTGMELKLGHGEVSTKR